MKQGLLRGFGAGHLAGAVAPFDMPDEVVTLCKTEADAILWSINYATHRFGYTQRDIAKLCGWRGGNHLSSYARGAAAMPEKRQRRFAQVTGCNLLEQHQRRLEIIAAMAGTTTPNSVEKTVLAMMLRAAA